MVLTYSEEALKIAIAQLAQNVGWHGIGSNSFEILIDLCARFMREIGKTSKCIANQYNRTQVNFDDMQLAFNYMGVSLNELEDYYTHVEAIPFVKGNLVKYPIKSAKGAKRINYPDQNELKARAEFYEEWMPSIKLDVEDDSLLNSKIVKDTDLINDSMMLNGTELSEEEMDKRYINSLKNQVGADEKIGGFTELDALVPNYIYLSSDGQALCYGGKEGKLPECKLPPLTADDLERIKQEEERKKQELQKEKEKTFQPLKLKINNKEKLKFKKYLNKDIKSKNDYMSKELLKRAKKDKKLKPKMNLSKLSIKMPSLGSNNLNKVVEEEVEDENEDSLKQKQDLIETAEKLGLSNEIDELKKLNKLKEKNMKARKIKVLKKEDLEKQMRKRERMRKKQEELERKMKLREERRQRKEAREREKEEKRKARERKRMEKLKAKQEKGARKPKSTKKGKNVSKAEIDESNSNLSLNSSLTNNSTIKNNTSTNSNLNEYDEKEAANILVSLSEDKKSSSKKSSNKKPPKLTSPIESSEDEESLISSEEEEEDEEDDDDDDDDSSTHSSISKEEYKKNETSKQPTTKSEKPKKNDQSITNVSLPAAPVKPTFKSLAERKAMPPQILDNNKQSTPAKKVNKFRKRKNEPTDNSEIDNLFKPMFTIPTIKKNEKKPKKKFSDEYIETSSSSEDERALISKKKDDKKKIKKKDESSLPKLTVKLPSRTNSPLPSTSISPKSSKKPDKSIKKDDKKPRKELIPEKIVKNKKDEKDISLPSKKVDKLVTNIGSSKLNNNSNNNISNIVSENKPKKKAKVIITPTKAARKEAQEKGNCVLVTQTVSTNEADDKVWYCPICSKPDDGSPMIGKNYSLFKIYNSN